MFTLTLLKTDIVDCEAEPYTETYSVTALISGTLYLAAEPFEALSFSITPVSALFSFPGLTVANLNPGDQIAMVLKVF
jgi:hypothetical protein